MADEKIHPALTITSIKNTFNVQLSLENGQYLSWLEIFEIYCHAYKVIDHIIPPPPPATSSMPPLKDAPQPKVVDPETWSTLDAIVLQWIYSTISNDLMHTILEPDTTAGEAWKRLKDIFQDNKNSRAVYLEHEFTNTRLDNFSSVSAYCQELKMLSDQLTNVGAPVSNNRLILQLIASLNESYDIVASLIQQTVTTGTALVASSTNPKTQQNSPFGTTHQSHAPHRNFNSNRGHGRTVVVVIMEVEVVVGQTTTITTIARDIMDIDSILFLTCGKAVESTRHIFFTCQIARDILHLITSCVPNNLDQAMHTMTLNPPDDHGIWIWVLPLTDDISSVGDLYPITKSALKKITAPSTLAAISQDLWHHRLGYSKKTHGVERGYNLLIVVEGKRGYINHQKLEGDHRMGCDYKVVEGNEGSRPGGLMWCWDQLEGSSPPPSPINIQSSPSRPTSQSSLLSLPLQPNMRATCRVPSTSRTQSSNIPPATPLRTMHTQSMSGISKPKNPFNLFVTTSLCPIPRNPKDALSNPYWKSAMVYEYNALIENKTWELVPRTPDMHVIRCMWIFRHKLRPGGFFERYKARLVGDGRSQQVGVDCDETFSLVVKPATIRSILTLAISKSWSIPQLDVKNAFLHGTLNETVYMYQPMGFRDAKHPDYVCLLKKSLYGLKQAPRACNGRDLAYILLYVDDIILTTSSDTLRHSIIGLLAKEFAMKDLGPLNYFLGIAVTRHKHGEPYSDPTHYRSLVRALQYFTFTRPDISYSVQQMCLHMHDPREKHMTALKRILRYIQGTLHYGLHLYKSQISTLVSYTDADWGGCPDTRRSTSGAEAEYRGVANVVSESCWLRNLLLELRYTIQKATLVYCDNVSAIFLSGNLIQHQRTKHIEMDIHFVREKVARGEFEFYMFHLVIKLLISLPKVFPVSYLMTSETVLAFVLLPLRLGLLAYNVHY
ncbi:copia protein [Tanacetum coccineum]